MLPIENVPRPLLCAYSSPQGDSSIQSPSTAALSPPGLYALAPSTLQALAVLSGDCSTPPPLPGIHSPLALPSRPNPPVQLPARVLAVFPGPAHQTSFLEALRLIIFPPHAPWWLLQSSPSSPFLRIVKVKCMLAQAGGGPGFGQLGLPRASWEQGSTNAGEIGCLSVCSGLQSS